MENEAMIIRGCPTAQRTKIYLKSEIPEAEWPENVPPSHGANSMGDRFYMQQNAKKRPTTNKAEKRTKAAVVADLGKHLSVDLKVLTQDDLEVLLEYFVAGGRQLVSHKQPAGRLKAPWVEALKLLVSDSVDWNKCTVATMKAVYEEIVNVD